MNQTVEILIVEDSRTQAAQLQYLLERHDFRVSCAGNGVEALAAIRNRRPSLVMSTVVMPEMDGYQLCRQIKDDAQLRDLPIILMTTLADPGEVIKALSSKADNFITKPCNEDFLLSRIQHVLANQELRKNPPADGSVEILYDSEKHRFTSDPAQILDLLLSTFDNAVKKTLELEAAHDEQLKAHLALQKLNERLEEMNEHLEEMVDTRTHALALTVESHRALLDNNADAIIVADQTAKVRFVNPAAETLLGRPANELRNTQLEFPIIVGETKEIEVPQQNAESLITEMRVVETLWEGEPASLASLRDVTERKRSETVLQQAKEAAEAGNQAKSDFLANMSHELRTPMNGIIGMTGLLLDSELTPEQREHGETVKTSSESLLNLINQILDFSKIEAGNFDLESQDFDLRTVVDEVIDQFAKPADDKGLELATLMLDNVPTFLRGDPGRIRQILVNLMDNALKFTETGEIILRVTLASETAAQSTLHFAVTDTGIGIPAERMDRLFQSFSQIDSSSTRVHTGIGMGLALSKRLAELMGGEIGVESKPDQGSMFWFTVQCEKRPGASLPAQSQRDGLNGITALVVDDNATNRTLLHHQLTSWGVQVETAEDARRGMEMLLARAQGNRPYDVALLDWQMPEISGLELAKAIRANSALADLRLVLLTSEGRKGEATRARATGIHGYLTKPVQQSQLYDCLCNVMLADAPIEEPPRFLVAEDNRVNQKLLVRLLEKLGYEADVALNGQEALAACLRSPYAVVLMDCQMAIMDEFVAVERIRAQDQESGTHTPIIALNSYDLVGDRQQCLAAGMDDHVSEPVNPQVLNDIVSRWLSGTADDLVAHSTDSAASLFDMTSSPGPILPAAPDQPGILVVEDNAVNQKLTVRLLEKFGYQADVAANGREALEAMERSAYLVVLMDCQMPVMDGFTATAHIRERDQESGTHTPIIAVTANALKGDRERCLAAGMDDYISKPVNPKILKDTLVRWLPRPSTDEKENGTSVAPDFDLSEALARVDGDREVLCEMAELFWKEYPDYLSQIETAINGQDFEGLEYAAHALKGSVSTFAATDASEAASTLEQMGRRQALAEAPAILAQLEASVNRLKPALVNLGLDG